MAKFNVPLSKIIQLAKTQACTYYLECHKMALYHSKTSIEKLEYEREMVYWDQVHKYLQELEDRRLHP